MSNFYWCTVTLILTSLYQKDDQSFYVIEAAGIESTFIAQTDI